MKLLKVALIAAGVIASLGGYSQPDTTRNPTDTIKPGKPDTTMLSYAYTNSYTSMNNDISIVADTIKPDTSKTSYGGVSEATTTGTEANVNVQAPTVPQPNFGRYYIPVIGTYAASTESQEQNRSVTVRGDEQNPGKVWIEGLTSEKIYALRKANAGTYKIPAQKVNDNNIPEGTLLYDDNSREVRICIGRKYVDNNPSEAFNVQIEETVTTKKNKRMAEKKASVISFTGTKTEQQGTAKM
jgi:anti-sigma28 factor (negative regulator of flagellin synthesis)